jgi:hypothetical protein
MGALKKMQGFLSAGEFSALIFRLLYATNRDAEIKFSWTLAYDVKGVMFAPGHLYNVQI